MNSKGEDFIQILHRHYTNDGFKLDKENADVVIRYAEQTIRATREVIVEMVRLQEYPEYPSRLSCLYAAKSYEDALKWKELLILIIEMFCRSLNFGLLGISLKETVIFYQRKMELLSPEKSNKPENIGKAM